MKIAVGQGSCGIAAGSMKVYNELLKLLEDKSVLTITGCIGMCFLEPVVDIYDDKNTLHRCSEPISTTLPLAALYAIP